MEHPCHTCQYDLTATPVADGVKRCPECGSVNPPQRVTDNLASCRLGIVSAFIVFGQTVGGMAVIAFGRDLHKLGQLAQWAAIGLGLLVQPALATVAILMVKRSDARRVGEPFALNWSVIWKCLKISLRLTLIAWAVPIGVLVLLFLSTLFKKHHA